jgi:hypothetical protein
MNYEIKITEHKHPVPYVVFEDKSYDLLGEFLLAERSFRREILSLTNDVDLGISESECFTGNAFTLEINKDTCKITNDNDSRELEVTIKDFKAVLLDYIYALREIKVKEKMASLKHDHEHHHH